MDTTQLGAWFDADRIYKREDFHFFWSTPLSQWPMYDMVLGGVTYGCCEQYMMAEKARLFNDERAQCAIMCAEHPRDQKAIGREVRNFDDVVWKQHCREIVFRGNWAKFTQHLGLLEMLINTGDKIIVEASPEDKIWGIGMRSTHPWAHNPRQWAGTNWLGEALMRVRREIREMPKDDLKVLLETLKPQAETLFRGERIDYEGLCKKLGVE